MTKKRKAKGETITLKGAGANAFMAAMMVQSHGPAAMLDLAPGPMLDAVGHVLGKRQVRLEATDPHEAFWERALEQAASGEGLEFLRDPSRGIVMDGQRAARLVSALMAVPGWEPTTRKLPGTLRASNAG